MAASMAYYVDVLGFEKEEWSNADFGCVSRDGCSIYLSNRSQGQPGAYVWVGVEDVGVLYEEYKRSGAKIHEPPTNYPWALQMQVCDPDGNVLRIGSDPA